MNTPTLITEVPENFPEMLRENGAAIVVGAFQQVGFDNEWPKPTADVLALVAAMGFDCTYQHLVQINHDRQMEPPQKFGVAFTWQPDDVVRLLLLLDRKRRWLPGFHRNRKTPAELHRDEREASKGMAMIEWLCGMTFEELEDKFASAEDESFKQLVRMAHTLKRANHKPARRFTPSPTRDQQCPS